MKTSPVNMKDKISIAVENRGTITGGHMCQGIPGCHSLLQHTPATSCN